MKKILTILMFLVILCCIFLTLGLAPSARAAMGDPLVTCGYERQCELKDLVGIIPAITDILLTYIVPGLATIFIIIGAGLMLFSMGDVEKFSMGKNMIVIALIGLVIGLGSKIIINMIITTLGGQNVGTP